MERRGEERKGEGGEALRSSQLGNSFTTFRAYEVESSASVELAAGDLRLLCAPKYLP